MRKSCACRSEARRLVLGSAHDPRHRHHRRPAADLASGAPRMTGAAVLGVAREGIWVMILIGAPMMTAGLGVGVVIALFQALTQIQDMTLVFVPKILAIFVVMLLSLPFMGAMLGTYMTRLVDMIITGG